MTTMRVISKEHKLPPGWSWTTVGEICQNVQYGYTASSKPHGIGPRFLRITDIQNGSVSWEQVPYCEIDEKETQKYRLTPGDIVFARTGATVGKSYLIGANVPEAVFASYLIRVSPYASIDSKYISTFFQSNQYWKQIFTQKAGIGQPNVNATKLQGIALPLPPIQEQHRIVNKIEELFTKLDAAVDALKKAKVQLKLYRQAVLKAAFEGKLSEKWRSTNGHRAKLTEEVLQRIGIKGQGRLSEVQSASYGPYSWGLKALPSGWVWGSLSLIGTWSGGGTPSKKVPGYWENGDIMWVTPKDMKSLKVKTSELSITVEGLNNSSAKMIGKDSVAFVVRSGILRRILPVAIIESDTTVNQDLQALTPYDFVNPNFVLYWALYQEEKIRAKCSKTGTTVESIESHLLKRYPFPLCTREEQDEVVKQIETSLSLIERAEDDIATNLRKAEPLRSSVLWQAFRGKLVPQDPTDEPASKLMERIKAEKAVGKPGEQQKQKLKFKKLRRKGS